MKTNTYTLINHTPHAIKEVITRVQHAKQSILIDMYAIRDDHIGWQLYKVLAEKAKMIRVIVMVDDWGSRLYSRKLKKLIGSSRFEFIASNKIRSSFHHLDKLEERLCMRNHRKLVIIDEKEAYIGGLNLVKRELKWRDLLLKVKGPLVKDLIASFWETYEVIKNEEFFNPPINRFFESITMDKDCVVRQLPRNKAGIFWKTIERLFTQAKKEILLCTPYLAPHKKFLELLHKTAQRGVSITLLTTSKADNQFSRTLNYIYAQHYRKIGVKTLLYPTMHHAKFILIDGTYSLFGSANMDQQTFRANYELCILSKNKKLYKQLNDVWEQDKKKSKPFTERLWKKRPLIYRILTPFALTMKKYF